MFGLRSTGRLSRELPASVLSGAQLRGGGGVLASVHKETNTEFGWKVLVRSGTRCDNIRRAP